MCFDLKEQQRRRGLKINMSALINLERTVDQEERSERQSEEGTLINLERNPSKYSLLRSNPPPPELKGMERWEIMKER